MTNTMIRAAVAISVLALGAQAALAQNSTSDATKPTDAQKQSMSSKSSGAAGNEQVAQACLDNLSKFDKKMRNDGYWLSGWGSRWGYGNTSAMGGTNSSGGDASGKDSSTTSAQSNPDSTATHDESRAQPATGPWANRRWGLQSPRFEVGTLHDATMVLGHRGDQKGCEATLAALRQVYETHVADLKQAGVKPGNVENWRQERIALAKPVSDLKTGGIHVADIIDSDVRNLKDVDLGSVSDVIVDRQSGKITYVVVSHGGFWGIGDDYVAVPWDSLRATPGFNTVVIDVSEKTMDQAPRVDPDQFVDLTRDGDSRQKIDDFWQDHG